MRDAVVGWISAFNLRGFMAGRRALPPPVAAPVTAIKNIPLAQPAQLSTAPAWTPASAKAVAAPTSAPTSAPLEVPPPSRRARHLDDAEADAVLKDLIARTGQMRLVADDHERAVRYGRVDPCGARANGLYFNVARVLDVLDEELAALRPRLAHPHMTRPDPIARRLAAVRATLETVRAWTPLVAPPVAAPPVAVEAEAEVAAEVAEAAAEVDEAPMDEAVVVEVVEAVAPAEAPGGEVSEATGALRNPDVD